MCERIFSGILLECGALEPNINSRQDTHSQLKFLPVLVSIFTSYPTVQKSFFSVLLAIILPYVKMSFIPRPSDKLNHKIQHSHHSNVCYVTFQNLQNHSNVFHSTYKSFKYIYFNFQIILTSFIQASNRLYSYHPNDMLPVPPAKAELQPPNSVSGR